MGIGFCTDGADNVEIEFCLRYADIMGMGIVSDSEIMWEWSFVSNSADSMGMKF